MPEVSTVWRTRKKWRGKSAALSGLRILGQAFPGFGDPHAGTLYFRLAPGGMVRIALDRMFTGDRRGEFL